jgi:hypothetical protein
MKDEYIKIETYEFICYIRYELFKSFCLNSSTNLITYSDIVFNKDKNEFFKLKTNIIDVLDKAILKSIEASL